MTDVSLEKNAGNFYCHNCDFYCSKQSNFNKHILTRKHQNSMKILTNTDTKNAENAENAAQNIFICECGKEYKHRQSLFNHKKVCNANKQPGDFVFNKEIVMMVLQQNKEILKENCDLKHLIMDTQNQMMKVIESGTYNTTNNTTNNTNTINSHNKAFNLNFFLNETCKDAMNIMDFVESIKLQLSDLERVGEVGYVEGISNIIVKNLNELDVTQRPVHCTDKKRETMYIRDEDKWEKDENNTKIKKAIKRVASKNQRLLPKFKEAHPDCGTYHSKYSDQYNKIIIESVGGSGDNDAEKEEKIIRNISRNVVVEK